MPSSGPAAPARAHLPCLDGLRAVAALYVAAHHSWLRIWGLPPVPTGWAWRLTAWALFGHFAVDLFIVLSGFSLALPVMRGGGELRGGALKFFAKRARRILPPYYAACAVTALMVVAGHIPGEGRGIHLPDSLRSWSEELLLLQDVYGSHFNGAFWSVAVEYKIYFLFPALVWLWRRVGPLATTGLAAATSWTASVLLPGTQWDGLATDYVLLFTLGMLAAEVAFGDTLPARWRYLPWGGLAAILFTVVVLLSPRHWHSWLFHSYSRVDLIVGAWALALLVYVSQRDGAVRRVLEWRPLVWVGTFAYSVYLIHAPAIQLVWLYLVSPWHLPLVSQFALQLALGLPVIVALSYIFHVAFERPFLVRRKNESPAEVARDAAISPAP